MDFKKIEQKLNLNCILMRDENPGEIIKRNRERMHKIDRIPSIIDISKSYPEFKLVIDTEKFIGVKKVALVLEESEETLKIEIILNYKFFNYKELLTKILPINVEPPSSFQIIGDILHVNLNDSQMVFKEAIGDVLIEKNLGIKTVVTKIGIIDTDFRFFNVEVIAGQKELTTVHYEGGLKFFIDYERVYWNSKLQNERKFILKHLECGGVFCDPFAGVGPLALAALKKRCFVYANDLNPTAIECLRMNIELNHLPAVNIKVYNEDAAYFIDTLKEESVNLDYIFLNLPEMSLDYIHRFYFCSPKTAIFCYFFGKNDLEYEDCAVCFKNEVEIKMVRNVAPNKKMYRIVCKISDVRFDKISLIKGLVTA